MTSIEEFSLESLLTEELERLKEIQVKTIPKQVCQIGEGKFGKVFKYECEDGSFQAGKKIKISLFGKSAEDIEEIKKVSAKITIQAQIIYLKKCLF